MATRSLIGVLHNNQCKAVYCHFDGYLSGVGQTLINHYDVVKADQLVALGDISSLGAEIGEKHDFDNCPTGVTNFYGRDRGEDEVSFRTYASAAEMVRDNDYAEFIYLMHDGVWYGNYCNSNSPEWFLLADKLVKEGN